MKLHALTAMMFFAVLDGMAYFPSIPFPGPVGSTNTTAMHMSTNAFSAWASGYTNMVYGDGVGTTWKTPEKALGMAVGDAFDIVSLGRSGHITLAFPDGISDGDGFDFAVFENAIDDTFLELAWVEVSSDGSHFVRFPNFSLTPNAVGPFDPVSTWAIYGYGGKYRQGYGTPFDLAELRSVHDEIMAGTDGFSSEYKSTFNAAYSTLDFSNIQYVRIVDIVGDGADYDSVGNPIYDPYETFDSVGFDLDAVGVIHEAVGMPVTMPLLNMVSVDAFITMEYAFDSMAFTNDVVEESINLSVWSNAVPEVIVLTTNGSILGKTIRFPIGPSNRFYRLRFEEL